MTAATRSGNGLKPRSNLKVKAPRENSNPAVVSPAKEAAKD